MARRAHKTPETNLLSEDTGDTSSYGGTTGEWDNVTETDLQEEVSLTSLITNLRESLAFEGYWEDTSDIGDMTVQEDKKKRRCLPLIPLPWLLCCCGVTTAAILIATIATVVVLTRNNNGTTPSPGPSPEPTPAPTPTPPAPTPPTPSPTPTPPTPTPPSPTPTPPAPTPPTPTPPSPTPTPTPPTPPAPTPPTPPPAPPTPPPPNCDLVQYGQLEGSTHDPLLVADQGVVSSCSTIEEPIKLSISCKEPFQGSCVFTGPIGTTVGTNRINTTDFQTLTSANDKMSQAYIQLDIREFSPIDIEACVKQQAGGEQCQTLRTAMSHHKRKRNIPSESSNSWCESAWHLAGPAVGGFAVGLITGYLSRKAARYIVDKGWCPEKYARFLVPTMVTVTTFSYTLVFNTTLAAKILAKLGFTGAKTLLNTYGHTTLGIWTSTVLQTLQLAENTFDDALMSPIDFLKLGICFSAPILGDQTAAWACGEKTAFSMRNYCGSFFHREKQDEMSEDLEKHEKLLYSEFK